MRWSGARGAKVGSRFSFGLAGAACCRCLLESLSDLPVAAPCQLLPSCTSSSRICDEAACVSARLSMTSCTRQYHTHRERGGEGRGSLDTNRPCKMHCTHLCAVVWVFDGDILHRLQSVFALLFDLMAADQLVAVVRIAVGMMQRIRAHSKVCHIRVPGRCRVGEESPYRYNECSLTRSS